MGRRAVGDVREPGGEQVFEVGGGLGEGVVGVGVEHEALRLDGAGVDVLAGGVVEDAVLHAVDQQQRLRELLDGARAVELRRERGDTGDGAGKLAGLDDDCAAEGVADERDAARRADASQERDAGEDIEHALLELAGLAVVDAEAAEARAEAVGEAAVEVVGGALEAAHRAADVDGCARRVRAGVQDAADLAAGCGDHDAQIAIGLGMGGDALDGEFEVAVVVGRRVFAEVHGGRVPGGGGREPQIAPVNGEGRGKRETTDCTDCTDGKGGGDPRTRRRFVRRGGVLRRSGCLLRRLGDRRTCSRGRLRSTLRDSLTNTNAKHCASLGRGHARRGYRGRGWSGYTGAMRRVVRLRVLVVMAFALLAFAVAAGACERNNDLVAQEQIQQSQNACPKGCEAPLPGCAIKGNISSTGVKYYHLPQDADYDGIRIQVDKGERWFCNINEAVRNGWKAKPGL